MTSRAIRRGTGDVTGSSSGVHTFRRWYCRSESGPDCPTFKLQTSLTRAAVLYARFGTVPQQPTRAIRRDSGWHIRENFSLTRIVYTRFGNQVSRQEVELSKREGARGDGQSPGLRWIRREKPETKGKSDMRGPCSPARLARNLGVHASPASVVRTVCSSRELCTLFGNRPHANVVRPLCVSPG